MQLVTNAKPTIDINQISLQELEAVLDQKRREEKASAEKAQSDYKKKRDSFIKTAVASFCELSAALRQLKMKTLQRGHELHDEMFEVFEGKARPIKEFSMITEDGNYKLVIQKQERQALDETAEVAIGTIKEVFKQKFEARNKSMYNILDGLLIKNQKGDYDERLVAKLRKYESEIDDKDFSRALDDLSKAYYTSGSSTYCRAYRKNPQTGKWQDIPMQFSSF